MDSDIFWFNCMLRAFVGKVKDFISKHNKHKKFIIYISTVSLYPPQF